MKTPLRFRTIFLTLGILSILCLLSPAVIGIVAATLTYDGNCYGFTDGAAPCSWWQFAQNQAFYGLLIAFIPAVFLLIGWLTTGGLWIALRGRQLPAWQAALIPLAAVAIGILLIFFLPLFAGLRR